MKLRTDTIGHFDNPTEENIRDAVEEQETKHQLKTITREINSLKRKLSALEKKKIKLLESQNK